MLDSREAEQIWVRLANVEASTARIEALATTTANSVFDLSARLNVEAQERKSQDRKITQATADAIVSAVRDQLDRRAALSGSLSSGLTSAAIWVAYALIAAALKR